MTQPQPITPPKEPTPDDEELREFLMEFRRGMLIVMKFIEKKYDVQCRCETCEQHRRNRAA